MSRKPIRICGTQVIRRVADRCSVWLRRHRYHRRSGNRVSIIGGTSRMEGRAMTEAVPSGPPRAGAHQPFLAGSRRRPTRRSILRPLPPTWSGTRCRSSWSGICSARGMARMRFSRRDRRALGSVTLSGDWARGTSRARPRTARKRPRPSMLTWRPAEMAPIRSCPTCLPCRTRGACGRRPWDCPAWSLLAWTSLPSPWPGASTSSPTSWTRPETRTGSGAGSRSGGKYTSGSTRTPPGDTR